MSEMNEKNVTMNEEMANNEEQNKASEAGTQQDQNEKKDNKVIAFFKKNGKKIGGAAAIVGAVGVGVVLDRVGVKIPFGKKKDDEQVETTED